MPNGPIANDRPLNPTADDRPLDPAMNHRHLDRSEAERRDPRISPSPAPSQTPCVPSFAASSRRVGYTNASPIRLSLMSLLRPKFAKAALLATLLLSISLLGAADPEARFNKLGHDMICMCGCNQILVECNHVGCPVSPVMIGELRDQIDKGGPDNLIFNWFAAKYGATAIAAPMRGGFDDVAWITPLAVFFLATVGVAFLVTVWKKRNPPALAPVGPSIDDATRNRIRRETEY
jgi:cytochrome c-type biogenesis protein CcmH/NrfF